MYEYLISWTGVAKRPAPGALKNTGQINQFLLGTVHANDEKHLNEARDTFQNLNKEFTQKLKAGMAAGPLYRLMQLTQQQQEGFKKDQIYVSPCFEAYSKERLVPGGNFALMNTRFVIIDQRVPGADLAEFNPQQKEVLIRVGTLFAVSAKRTSTDNPGVLEIGLTYIGDVDGDARRAIEIGKQRGIDPL